MKSRVLFKKQLIFIYFTYHLPTYTLCKRLTAKAGYKLVYQNVALYKF